MRTGVQVAVKVLHRTALGWDSFRQEVDTLRQVAEHPGVVTLLDAELDHNPPFFVMPWLRRGSLADLPQRPTLNQAVQWFREAAQALQYTHDKGILHCDIKPSNLLLDEEGHVRLVDFGQSLLHDGAGRSLGTIGFMPPEQLQGPPNVRWDIYSLGATAYFLLTGQVPRLSKQDRSSLSSGTMQQRTQLYLDLMHERPLLSSRGLNLEHDAGCALDADDQTVPQPQVPALGPEPK